MAKTETKTPKNDAPTAEPSLARPPKRGKAEPESTEPKFWKSMAKIEAADWGSRANIYLYRVEPITDRLRGGDKKYVMCYGEPISEDRLMIDHGSGRYKAILTFKKPASDTGDEIDKIYLDIFNPKFPPKIPPGEWMDDPRNKKWAWAKQYVDGPAPPQPAQTPLSNVVEIMQATNEMRKTAIEEMRQNQPAQPERAADPMLTAMTFFREVMSAKADNPMVDVMRDELKAVRQDLADQRKRADDLLEKLATKTKEDAAPTNTSSLIKTFFDGFKELREQAAEILPAGRGRALPWWQETLIPSITRVLEPIATTMAQHAMAQTMQPNPPQPGQPPPPQVHQSPGAQQQPQGEPFVAFLDRLTTHMLHFIEEYDKPASEFASWFHDGYPEAQRAIDQVTRIGGVPALMQWYRTSRHWPMIAGMEAEFTKFLQDVIAWRPPETEAETPPAADSSAAPVIDLEPEEATT
jgi:hypothetical protein